MILDPVHAQWVAEKWLRNLGVRWSFDIKEIGAGKVARPIVPAIVLPDSSGASIGLLGSLPLRGEAPRAVAFVRNGATRELASRASADSVALFALDDDGDARALSPEAERLWAAAFGSPRGGTNLGRVRRSATRLATGSPGRAAGKTLMAAFAAVLAGGSTVAGAVSVFRDPNGTALIILALMCMLSAGLLKLCLTLFAQTRHFSLRERPHGPMRLPGYWSATAAVTAGTLAVGGAIALVPATMAAQAPPARTTCSYTTPPAADAASSVAQGLKDTVYSATNVVRIDPEPRPDEPRLVPSSTAGITDMRTSSDSVSPAVVIEVFARAEDAEDRSASLLAGTGTAGRPSTHETHHLAGAVLLRLSDRLTEAARRDYLSALGCS
ncbi:hypothetical protein [Sinomonas atrocyanea]|uniref:hypothetical protein n=1 Tax=Sinomonas atrocyanea TaxID=37927 RepID=UPI002864CDB6|nr:hypothetical protein [Sinomonas atrocyanea]MDR6621091.1 hypothetical protein [Sinomonas atrocyanea]